MNYKGQSVRSTIIAVVLGLMLGTVSLVEAKPLKVFILAGQSNMEGPASIKTFDYIGDDPVTAPMLKEMLGPDGKPVVCDKCMAIVSNRRGQQQCR